MPAIAAVLAYLASDFQRQSFLHHHESKSPGRPRTCQFSIMRPFVPRHAGTGCRRLQK